MVVFYVMLFDAVALLRLLKVKCGFYKFMFFNGVFSVLSTDKYMKNKVKNIMVTNKNGLRT